MSKKTPKTPEISEIPKISEIPDISISEFAAAAQAQYEIGHGQTHISLDEAISQLSRYSNMDKQLLVMEMTRKGCSESQIAEAVENNFQPSLKTLVDKLKEISETKANTLLLLKEMIARQTSGTQSYENNKKFIEYLENTKFVIDRMGKKYISKSIVSILLIKFSNIGELIGAFLIDSLKPELSNCMPTISGDVNKLTYLGYTKARFANLTDFLVDFEFVDNEYIEKDGEEIERWTIRANRVLYLNHVGLLQGLRSAGVGVDGGSIQFAENNPDNDPSVLSQMKDLGFFLSDNFNDEEVVGFYSLGLKPSPLLASLISDGMCRVSLQHIKVPRGRDFKFETLIFDGSLWYDFYRVYLESSEWIRKENQAGDI